MMTLRPINNFHLIFLVWTCAVGLATNMANAAVVGTRGVSRSAPRGRALKDKKPPSQRDCKMEAEGSDFVEFQCKAKMISGIGEDASGEQGDEEIKDKIEYKISTNKERGLAVKVEYEQEIETSEMETETETQFDVFFTSLVEYAKSDSSFEEGYDWENDIVVQTIPLPEKLAFSDILDDEDGVTSSFFADSKNADDVGASFKFTVSRAGEGENRVTANKIKIDFKLVDFPWMRDDTYVALITSIESKKEVEVEYEDDHDHDHDHDDDKKGSGESADDSSSTMPSLKSAPHMPKDVVIPFGDALTSMEDVGATMPFGEYTWAKTALVQTNATAVLLDDANGTVVSTKDAALLATEPTTISVVATSPRDQRRRLADEESKQMSHQDIAFSFVGDAAHLASEIYWDPEAGVGYSTSGGALVTSFGALFGLIGAYLLL